MPSPLPGRSCLLLLLCLHVTGAEIPALSLAVIQGVWDIDLERLDLEAMAEEQRQWVEEAAEIFAGIRLRFEAEQLHLIHHNEGHASQVVAESVDHDTISLYITELDSLWTIRRSPTGLLISDDSLPVPIPLLRTVQPDQEAAAAPLHGRRAP